MTSTLTWYREDDGVYPLDGTTASGGLGLKNEQLGDGGTQHTINAIGVDTDKQRIQYLYDGTKSVVFDAASRPILPTRGSSKKNWYNTKDRWHRFYRDGFIQIWPTPTLTKSEVSKIEPWMREGTTFQSQEEGSERVTKIVAFRQTNNSLRYTFVVPVTKDRDFPESVPVWTNEMLNNSSFRRPDFFLHDTGYSNFKFRLKKSVWEVDPVSGVQTVRSEDVSDIEDIGPQPGGWLGAVDRLVS